MFSKNRQNFVVNNDDDVEVQGHEENEQINFMHYIRDL